MKNQYKRTDIFACNYETHSKFNNRVSVYHVMRAKKCYPQGCLFFKWHCSLLQKGKSCRRGYEHVGRKCSGCKYYYDEKIHYQPKVMVTPDEYRSFEEELEEFEEWLAEKENNEITFFGKVETIKPRFHHSWNNTHGQVRLKGWLVTFAQGFIGTESFEDPLYAHISPHQQERFRIAPGDQFEVRATLSIDRGRIILTRLRGIDIEQRSGEVTWTNGQALVARQSATFFEGQPAKCLACHYGALVDVEDRVDGRIHSRRALYCLKGIVDPQVCYVSALETIDSCSIG
jgi:hypothetical protein